MNNWTINTEMCVYYVKTTKTILNLNQVVQYISYLGVRITQQTLYCRTCGNDDARKCINSTTSY